MMRSKPTLACLITGVALFAAGCGGDDAAPATTQNSAPAKPAADNSGESPAAPTASIGSKESVPTQPQKGTPPWYLQRIKAVRMQVAKEDASLEDLRQFRRERNDEIIDLATQILAVTHDKEEQIDYFNLGVQELLEARLQNAMQGSAADFELLENDAAALVNRDGQSTAAMLASYALVRYAHTTAQRLGQREPERLAQFSRLARGFAQDFPEESTRSIPLLTAAALTCEMHEQPTEARLCHTVLAEKFPDSPQGRFSVGVLRRLGLVGRPFEFSGPTLEGGFITIDDFKDKVVLISFWSSDDEEFAEKLPALQALHDKYHAHGFEIVGVCLDEDEAELNRWLEEHPLPWRQIFVVDPEQRRFSNPIVQYYGVREIPSFWLADHEGIMRNTTVDPAAAEAEVRELLLALRAKLAGSSSDN